MRARSTHTSLLQLVCATAVLSFAQHVSAAYYAPNRFLGTCLTEEWVKGMETKLGVSASARDPVTNQLVHPFLHAALPGPRYAIDDARTSGATSFSPSCVPNGEAIYGPDAVVDPDTGEVKDIGRVAGSLVLEVNEGAVHRLNTMIFAILARELIGYNVSIYYAAGSADIAKRITFTDPQAWCTPVHTNVAVATRTAFSQSTWLVLGELGNRLVQGLYTTNDFITDGRDPSKFSTPFYADFWRDYVTNNELIEALAESNLRDNPQYFPPNTTYCKDKEWGCMDHCQKTYACTLREKQTQHKECLVIAAMHPAILRYYWPAMLNNLDFPAYMCFIGRDLMQNFVLDMYNQGKAVLFYLNYPDEFLVRYAGKFQRISMPKGTAADQAKNTLTYGEHGYGNKTDNPVRVDRFDDTNQKIVSYNMLSDISLSPAISVFARTRVPDTAIESILDRYTTLTNDSSDVPDDPYFDATCGWMRDNYKTWKNWMLMPLPMCTALDHMTHTLAGCGNNSSVREISFEWTVPNPTNTSNPYVCDGGNMTIPPNLLTSRSCEWLEDNYETWYSWIYTRPSCDDSFYAYTTSDCAADSRRDIEYHWLLPDADNASLSHECAGELPDMIEIECEYMPILSRTFLAITIIVWILIAVIVVSMVIVFRHRNLPIIRRSQYEFLEAMLIGALCVSFAIVMYAGEPNDATCGTRPTILSVGFTLVFGSLVVKTLRVYRIFNTKKMKRVVLPTKTMFKFLVGFLLVDAAILITWFVVDFPSATKNPSVVESSTKADVIVYVTICSSSSFIFSALLIFWKAILLGTGLYLSFQVRKVSSDFQESIYIFSSSVVVAFACLLLLPLAYLVPLAATTFYVFFAIVLWLSTLSVVGLMLLPKFIRHRETTSSLTTSGSSEGAVKLDEIGSEDHKAGYQVTKSSNTSKYVLRVTPAKDAGEH